MNSMIKLTAILTLALGLAACGGGAGTGDSTGTGDPSNPSDPGNPKSSQRIPACEDNDDATDWVGAVPATPGSD